MLMPWDFTKIAGWEQTCIECLLSGRESMGGEQKSGELADDLKIAGEG
jgi:hypothetical protein